MSNIGKCQFYRKSKNPAVGIVLGHCDLGGGQAICEGDMNFCERPDELGARLQEKTSLTGKGESKTEKSSGYKVLVVDDNAELRKLVVALLSTQNHHCVTATDGVDALNKAIRDKFDAVITDIVMPEMDGIALSIELLSLYPNLPIMVMSGHSKEYPTESAIKAGAQDFIGKPFSIEDFILRFDKMMRDRETLSRLETMQNEAVLGLGKKS